MSEYCFGLASGHLSARAATAAHELGAELVNYTEPRGERRHWFSAPNLGEPFDAALGRKVLAALGRRNLLAPITDSR